MWIALLTTLACLCLASCASQPSPIAPEPRAVTYGCWPGMLCLEDRVIAETDPALSASQRAQLWDDYGLDCTFEWVVPVSGFTYHELQLRERSFADRVRYQVLRIFGGAQRAADTRGVPGIVNALNEDPRMRWASPDALLLEWAADEGSPPATITSEMYKNVSRETAKSPQDADKGARAAFIDDRYRALTGGLDQWLALGAVTAPLPDFEFYRECTPRGTAVDWAEPLASTPQFMAQAATVYGTGQQAALDAWRAAGSPALTPVTVCVADTGVLMNHPDLAGRLHPNAIDANYRNYAVAAAGDRPAPETTLSSREDKAAVGGPREAIQDRPASHGTCVAGIVTRCTAGFLGPDGKDAVRILPASIRSEKAYVITGTRIKSPISSFVKLISCLSENYPTAAVSSDPKGRIANDGDVRVVSVSASIPRAYFSGRQWRVVAPLISKAAGSIAEDLRTSDRLYLFAAGNEAQAEPNRPGDEPYVMCVSACMPFDPAAPWLSPGSKEGANVGEKCVSAPGYAVITSTLYECPNLAYLPAAKLPQPRPDYSVPKRGAGWTTQTNTFSATSAATPQVSSLAALLMASQPQLTYAQTIQAIEASVGERRVVASYGEARGLIDYAQALGW